jgi:peptidoglycan-associated lipoprotein
MKRLTLVVVAALSAGLVAGACGGSKPSAAPPPSPNADSIARARQDSIRRAQEAEEARRRAEEERMRQGAAERARIAAEVRNMLATMIHFDYDKSNIRTSDAAALDSKVAILRANPNVRLRISGHCDERGSDEYNLALGNRRATSTKQYLVSHGIDASRIETLSFGEERPAAMGHDEAAWAQNRRSEFEIIAGGDALVRP